eukprot:2691348-Alexandrium_andersonii.AAC.1
MAASPPSDAGAPVTVVVRFLPTLPTPETRALVDNLPPDFKARQAQCVGCLPEELRTMAALELPDCGIAREYGYIQDHGPDSGVSPLLVAQSTWTREEMKQCVESIIRFGKPTPPRFVVIAFKK